MIRISRATATAVPLRQRNLIAPDYQNSGAAGDFFYYFFTAFK
jgi:hypothetical protein